MFRLLLKHIKIFSLRKFVPYLMLYEIKFFKAQLSVMLFFSQLYIFKLRFIKGRQNLINRKMK